MPLQTSGTISLSDIQNEFTGTNPISLSEYYRNGVFVPDAGVNNSIPTSGTVSLSDFYGGTRVSYTLTRNVASIYETETVSITLTTVGVSDNTQVPYTITGITAGDLTSNTLTGNFTVVGNTATETFTADYDGVVEGDEVATLTLDNNEGSITWTILTPTFSLARSATTINEGGSITITLTTTGIANGTNIPYTVTGINSNDLSSGSITGNFTVNSNSATQSFTMANDFTTEGTEVATLTLSGPATNSISWTINDTSVPTYSLSRSASTISEGNTFTITLTTQGVPDGTKVGYKLSGVTAFPRLTYILDNPNAYGTAFDDQFGTAVALNGDNAIISAPLEDSNVSSAGGRVYILDISDGTLVHTISNPNIGSSTSSNDQFGDSVAISSTHAIVGSPRNNDDGNTFSGKAHIFNISTGNLVHTLTNPNAYGTTTSDQFGTSVAIDSTYAIVGTNSEDAAGATDSGAAYIFSVSTGNLVYTLNNPNAYGTAAGDNFGRLVAIDGSYAVVTAVNEDESGNLSSGKVYIFSTSTGNLVHTLNNPNAYGTAANDFFGSSIAISGNYVIVGAANEDDAGGSDSGKAYIFNASTGALLHTLNNPNAYGTAASDQFGTSVATDGSKAIVGTFLEDDAGGTSSGKVYVYDVVTGIYLYAIDNPNPYGTSANDNIGRVGTIAIDNNKIVFGAKAEEGFDAGATTNSGKAYVYDLADTTDNLLDVTTSAEYFTVNSNTATITVTTKTNDDSFLYVLGNSNGSMTVRQFNVSSDLQNIVTERYFVIPSGAGSSALGMYFRNNGSTMWLQDPSDDKFHRYTLSTAWDISTAGSTVNASYGTVGGNHQGMWISPAGLSLYQVDRNLQYILYDPLGTAWNPFSPGSPLRFLDIGTNASLPTGIAVKADGTVAFISNLGSTGGDILEFSGTGNRPDLWTFQTEITISGSSVSDVFVPEAGTTMYVTDDTFGGGPRIHYYTLSTAWDLSTATLVRTVSLNNYFEDIHACYLASLNTTETFSLTLNATADNNDQTGSPTITVNITG